MNETFTMNNASDRLDNLQRIAIIIFIFYNKPFFTKDRAKVKTP